MFKENEHYLLHYSDYKTDGIWKGNLEVRQKTESNPTFGVMRLRLTKELPLDWAIVGNAITKNELAGAMIGMLFIHGIYRSLENPQQQRLN